MMTDDQPINLTLQVYAPSDASDEEVFERTDYLKDEIEELRIDEARLVKTDAPEGAKAGEAILIGTLAVTTLPTILTPLIALVRDWLSRPRNQDIRIKAKIGGDEIEISYPSTAVPQIDVQQWLEAVLAKRETAVIKNQSGGTSVEADEIGVKGDLVGGNKSITINVAAGATVQVDSTGNAMPSVPSPAESP